MREIAYRTAAYDDAEEKGQLLALYRDIFHIDFREGYDKWFSAETGALGIVAVDEPLGRIVGNFTSVPFQAVVGERKVSFRMSMGFMTDPEYRGQGIATELYRQLRKAVVERGDARFIIGFPNDVSCKMHVERMDYRLQRQFQFVCLPKGIYRCGYKKTDRISSGGQRGTDERNHMSHDERYMKWRYGGKNYDKWTSESELLFISTRFQDKADILYWSEGTTEQQLLDFAAFLYSVQDVKRVTTWNSEPFLDKYPKEERTYHMCINTLDCTPLERALIRRDWRFCMGDCELF